MRKAMIPALIAAGMLLLQGCSGGSVTESTIEISKKGAVTQTTVGTLDETYFSGSELKSYVKNQVAAYDDDDAAVGTVKLKKYKYSESDQTVRMVLRFSDADTYADFENLTFFVGTVSEAQTAGYDFAVTLVAAAAAPSADEMASGDASADASGDTSEASGDASADAAALPDLTGEEEVVILQESYQVVVPGEVLYVTDGTCGIVSDDTVSVAADEEQLVYIIYE